MQIWGWGVRGTNLVTIILVDLIILAIPTLWWIRCYRKITREISEDDEWLTDERVIITHRQPTMVRSAIVTLKRLPSWKKTLTTILVGTLVVSSIWLFWEWWPCGYYRTGVVNQDTRVFIESTMDQESGVFSIMGIHNHFLDSRSCRLQYDISYMSEVSKPINVTADWNLICKLSAGPSSLALLRVRVSLCSSRGNYLYGQDMFSIGIVNNITEINTTSQSSLIHIRFHCSSGTLYYVYFELRMLLEGDSSITGLEPGTPAKLIVHNLTIETVEPLE